jgi:hypothetical protein
LSERHVGEINGQLAADTLAYYWQKEGRGPTWSEFADLMDWPQQDRDKIIRQLTSEGWLRFKPVPRSLHPGTRNAEARRRYKQFQAARKQARKAASGG